MSSFNVIAMASLLTLLVVKGADIIADTLVHPVIQLETNVYTVEGVEASSDTVAEKPKELEAIEPLLASADLASGQKVAKKCLQCHTFEKDGASKLGPNLWNIVARAVGAAEGYAYSKAMSTFGGKWDFESLNKYLYKPRQLVNGTKMSFAGLKKPQERADLIAYLRTLSDSPQPLPQ